MWGGWGGGGGREPSVGRKLVRKVYKVYYMFSCSRNTNTITMSHSYILVVSLDLCFNDVNIAWCTFRLVSPGTFSENKNIDLLFKSFGI